MPEKEMFRFKKFSVSQELCAMKVGTDGVLLGCWADAAGCSSILDAGCGTGLIALIMEQRFDDCKIEAIDSDAFAYEQTLINISDNASRIQAFHAALQEWAVWTDKRYDMIICNPPFFLKGFPVPDAKRSRARAAENLTQQELLRFAMEILSGSGKLAVIYPVNEAKIFIGLCRDAGMHCKRMTTVFAKEDQPAKRILMEFTKYVCDTIEDKLVIEHDGQHAYTEAYKKLTGDFYLNF